MKFAIVAISILQIFFYNSDRSFGYNEIIMPENFPVKYQAWVMFTEIFGRHNFDFVPQDVRVLAVNFDNYDGHLTLDVSAEIMNYGGTYFEYYFVKKLIKNATSLEEVCYFTLLVEGELIHLPEGVKIYRALFEPLE